MENPREEHQYHHSTLLIFVILCLLSSSISANDESYHVKEEEEFDYIEGSKRGPEHWGNLKQEWTKCKDGTIQSPIPLSKEIAKLNKDLGQLNRSYKPGNATLKKNGHHIAVEWTKNVGSIQINGTNYLLQRCHWHHPSEHIINGERFDLELHMVHVANSSNKLNKMAVVALLFRFGPPNPFISKIADNLKLLDEGNREREVGSLDPLDAINKTDHGQNKNYYTYIGSLTTPPCSEPVIWTVMEQISSVSPAQVSLLRRIVDKGAKMNSRPLQEINHRGVFFYDSSSEAKINSGSKNLYQREIVAVTSN
ncbi:alpha carbonic anhydrase 7-like [Momordica charantia]|uniref:Carbonic anhydrase n=1 Tax=Momordica charantia TaxID=3673 RepID=A0A6J1CS74_MOMCH|nr:alpha carbonic anhydrase 7-like [Momordica charantia]